MLVSTVASALIGAPSLERVGKMFLWGPTKGKLGMLTASNRPHASSNLRLPELDLQVGQSERKRTTNSCICKRRQLFPPYRVSHVLQPFQALLQQRPLADTLLAHVTKKFHDMPFTKERKTELARWLAMTKLPLKKRFPLKPAKVMIMRQFDPRKIHNTVYLMNFGVDRLVFHEIRFWRGSLNAGSLSVLTFCSCLTQRLRNRFITF